MDTYRLNMQAVHIFREIQRGLFGERCTAGSLVGVTARLLHDVVTEFEVTAKVA